MGKRKSKSRFRGKISADSRKQKQAANSYGYLNLPKGINVYKPKPGSRAELDIIPYVISDPKHLDRDVETGNAIVGELWYKKPFKVHRSVGANNESVICPTTFGKKCPICEYRKKRQNEGADKDEIKSLYASNRNLYVVIPLNDKDNEDKMHIWDVSWYLFQKLLNDEVEENEDNEVFPDIEEGLTLKIRFDSKQFGKGKPYPEASRIDFKERDEQYTEEILDSVPDLDKVLKVLSYEEIQNMFFELDDEPTETIDEEDAEETSKPIRRKKVVKEEIEEEEIKEEEIEEEKPIRHRKKAVEKEDEEEVKPVKPVRRKHAKKEEPKEEENKCPFGHVFGADNDSCRDCDECAEWDACFDAKED